MIREKFPEAIIDDPTILLADDVIALSTTLDEMQAIADKCCEWAAANGLKWNPLKSKLLRIIKHLRAGHTRVNEGAQRQAVRRAISLDGTRIKESEEADYLGLRINIRRGFICKDIQELTTRAKAAIHMMLAQKWFSLCLKPKFISRLYDTYVRSIIVYGSELLSEEERKPLIELDDMLVRTYLKGLMKLKSIVIAGKHKLRMMLLLRIPTMKMELDRRCLGRVEAWAKRSGSDKEKVSFHARQSMEDISILQEDHPLRTARDRLEAGEGGRSLKVKQWENMEADSRSNNKKTSRHINTKTARGTDKHEPFPRFLKDTKLDPALKRAFLRWAVYKYPVRYKPSRAESKALEQVRDTDEMEVEEYKTWLKEMVSIFNKEQECWGLWKLKRAYTQDVRNRFRE